MEIVFWLSAATLAAAVVVFPAVVAARAWLGSPLSERRASRLDDSTRSELPMLSVIIAAYNEEASLAEKLESVLAVEYPQDNLEIIVASDGSTDRTTTIARQYAPRVRLLALPRCGKAHALNRAVDDSRGEVLVFSDANSLLDRQALLELARPFSDPRIGGVAGDQRYERSTAGTSEGEQWHWNLDRRLKVWQSRAGSCVSATGALYAIRRKLFQPVDEGVTDDFLTSTRVVAQGFRLVFAPRAVAWEPVARSDRIEFARKVRVMTRGFRAVWSMRGLLNPLKHGFYSIQLFMQKILKRLLFLPWLALLISSLMLWGESVLFRTVAVTQLAFLISAAPAFCLPGTRLGRQAWTRIPYYVCLVYVAAVVALINSLRGQRIVVWDSQDARIQPAVATSNGAHGSRTTS